MPDASPPVSAADRIVRLALSEHGPLIVPRDGSESFPVPPMAVSEILWLDQLARTFHRTRHRCLVVALMLDERHRVWNRPVFPTQSCGRDGVRWAWRAQDFTDRILRVRIGGSYQSALARDVHEAMALVPAVDGVHLVGTPFVNDALYTFVHAEGQTLAVAGDRFVVDDVAAAIDANNHRLSID